MTTLNPVIEHDSSINLYASIMDRYIVLSAEEEYNLAVDLYENSNLAAAQTLVLSQVRFVSFIAKKFIGYGIPFQDLMQEGLIGLMKAVKKFNPYEGVRLVSFAVHWIKAEIYNFIVDNWRIVKVATTKAQRKLFFNLRSMKGADEKWVSEYEAEKIAEELNVSKRDVYEMELRLTGKDVPLLPSEDEDDSNYVSPALYLEQSNADPADILEAADYSFHNLNRLQDSVNSLDARARDIIQRRWLNETKSTLQELAADYDVSCERIRQLESAAIKKLQSSMSC